MKAFIKILIKLRSFIRLLAACKSFVGHYGCLSPSFIRGPSGFSSLVRASKLELCDSGAIKAWVPA